LGGEASGSRLIRAGPAGEVVGIGQRQEADAAVAAPRRPGALAAETGKPFSSK